MGWCESLEYNVCIYQLALADLLDHAHQDNHEDPVVLACQLAQFCFLLAVLVDPEHLECRVLLAIQLLELLWLHWGLFYLWVP